MPAFPNVRLSRRDLHFFFLCDCSGSMAALGKMQSLNQSIKQSLPNMVKVAKENPEAQLLVRVIHFGDEAGWHQEQPTKVDDFEWIDLKPGGLTAMGAALELVASELTSEVMGERALPPIILLISDGQPTDDFEKGLRALDETEWGRLAIRLAIAIGSDVDLDLLKRFTGELDQETEQKSGQGGKQASRVLSASNAIKLAQYIEWVSTVVVGSVSLPATQLNTTDQGNQSTLLDVPATVLADPHDMFPATVLANASGDYPATVIASEDLEFPGTVLADPDQEEDVVW